VRTEKEGKDPDAIVPRINAEKLKVKRRGKYIQKKSQKKKKAKKWTKQKQDEEKSLFTAKLRGLNRSIQGGKAKFRERTINRGRVKGER